MSFILEVIFETVGRFVGVILVASCIVILSGFKKSYREEFGRLLEQRTGWVDLVGLLLVISLLAAAVFTAIQVAGG